MASKDNGSSIQSPTNLQTSFVGLDGEPGDTQCLLCNSTFLLPSSEKKFLSHLFEVHRLIIGDFSEIASLRSYVHYWRLKFKETALTKFCTTMLMDCTPDGKLSKDEIYYLLSDCLPEDKILREEIHRAKLELGLAQQAQEREDTTFNRECMFCKTVFCGVRLTYLKHLSQKHNVQLGKPENLVFVDRLLDKIQGNIENLRCIYCGKLFKSRTVLKEHMRKKLHKRINPNNRTYDQFYITNYLEPGSTWRQRQKEDHEVEEPTGFSSENEEESSWADWNGEEDAVTCLLCPVVNHEFSKILEHMKLEHNFDFEETTKNFNFYEKVKVANYLRRQNYEKKCIYCDENYDNVLEHMKNEKHEKLPVSRVWNQPEFYFPMYETDTFLYHLDSTSDDEVDETGDTSSSLKTASE